MTRPSSQAVSWRYCPRALISTESSAVEEAAESLVELGSSTQERVACAKSGKHSLLSDAMTSEVQVGASPKASTKVEQASQGRIPGEGGEEGHGSMTPRSGLQRLPASSQAKMGRIRTAHRLLHANIPGDSGVEGNERPPAAQSRWQWHWRKSRPESS